MNSIMKELRSLSKQHDIRVSFYTVDFRRHHDLRLISIDGRCYYLGEEGYRVPIIVDDVDEVFNAFMDALEEHQTKVGIEKW